MIIENSKFHTRQLAGKCLRAIFPKRLPNSKVLRLHLGCGSIDHPGFVNIDGIDRPHVHFVQRIDRLPRFQDTSVDFIYTSHTLEHFPRDRTVQILAEWRRVIVPGGRLCISVPDFDRILEIYKYSGGDLSEVLPPLFGGQDYPFNYHFTVFNASSLSSALFSAGFSHVTPWIHGSDEFHDLPDWSGRSILINDKAVPISLNLEAINGPGF